MSSLIIVVSGPGGVGKSTIVEALVQRDERLWLSRSWTTRERRPGEAEDAYVFVTRDQFQKRIEDNGFLEWTEFLGNLYGSPRPAVDSGLDIVLEIELHGAQQVKQSHPEAILVFVRPPSREEQQRRLQGRHAQIFGFMVRDRGGYACLDADFEREAADELGKEAVQGAHGHAVRLQEGGP